MTAIYLTIGGAVGAVCRYLLGVFMARFQAKFTIPIGMLTVNIIGSLGLGIFFGAMYGNIPTGLYNDALYVLLGIGFFGAFTTFSTFSMESFHLLEKRQYKPFFIYTGISVVGAIFCFVIGFFVFQSWMGG
ncbi:fluoride efflux transporter CrcB [Salibacterium salarium]|uniref:fluoride efflux transporter CrcB n=1 Tax=Salibacterium salarium TaxID=284579 RepID=UPI001FEBD26E|nr:fluoride efflux transporter CrcB [Salibacterium salarium]